MDQLLSTPGGHAVMPLAANFLVPNATFIAEVIAFAVIIWVLAKYVIPPINKAMSDRQDAIRRQFADLDADERCVDAPGAARQPYQRPSLEHDASAGCIAAAGSDADQPQPSGAGRTLRRAFGE